MSELFEFGLDFGLTYFEPLPKKKQLSMQEYRTGYVDFYDQTLDPTLGTGIDIPRGDDDDDDEEKKDINIYRIGQGDSTKSDDSSIPSPLDVSSANIYDLKSVPTYGEALGDAGFGDKTPFNVLGNDIYFGGIPRTKEEAKRGLERLVSKESLIRTGAKTASKFLGVNPLVSGTAAAFATGKTVKDPFGNASFRPSNFVLGGIHDINMSIQYDNVAQMQAAINTDGPKGYASYINGQLVTRPPKGFNYTGTYDVPRETLLRMDAISKGFVPSSFDYRTESGEQGIVDGIGGMYDERGVYHDRNGTSAYGSRKASSSLADRYGLTTTVVEQILSDVRKGDGRLSDKLREKQIEQGTTQTTTVDQVPDFDAYVKAQEERMQQIQSSESSDDGGGLSDADQDTGGYSGDDSFEDAFKTGGKVGQGMQGGGPAGFIGGPPENYSDQTTIADDIPLEVPEGAFVINAPAVEYAGSEDISKMLTEAYEKAGQGVDKSGRTTTIPSKEQVDIMISRGEVVVPPNIAKIIGYDRLEKINNRGKREVARRQKQGDQEKPQARQANMGGFMSDGGEVTLDEVKFKGFYSSPQKARKVIDDITKRLPLADALAILIEGEAGVLGEEGLEGAAHVLVNRADADYKDFGNSLYEELTKKTYGKNKIFQFNALEPTSFRKTLNRFKKDKNYYLKVRNIAEEVLAGARPDFTQGALFFKNPSASKAKDFRNKVQSGEFVETQRTVSRKNKNLAHIYYKPRDFGLVAKKQPQIEGQGFVDFEMSKQRIPESKGGSFLFRGSDYETGGATPAF